MRSLVPISIVMLSLAGGAASAQDTTVRSRTTVKADDARVMTMSGCLRQDAVGIFRLVGAIAGTGDKVQTKSKVKTDVDRDDVTVKGKTKTKVDDGAVATAGAMSTYVLVPDSSVDLASHVGHQVQVSTIAVEAGHGDADVKIKDKTKVNPDDAPSTTARSKTKLELPKSPAGSYTVVSVTPLAGTCRSE